MVSFIEFTGKFSDSIKFGFKTHCIAAALAISTKSIQTGGVVEKLAGIGVQVLILGYTLLQAKKVLKTDPHQGTSWEKFKSNTTFIEEGHGEYVIFHAGKKTNLTEETYEKAYEVLSSPKCTQNRAKLIGEKIAQIDPSLRISFIPRSIYDLTFIRACIEEEISLKDGCDLLRKRDESKRNEKLACLTKENLTQEESDYLDHKLVNCWHICQFDPDHLADYRNKFLRKLAFRMNNLVIDRFKPEGFFTGQKLSEITENELDFFKKHYFLCSESLNQGIPPYELNLYDRIFDSIVLNFGSSVPHGRYFYCSLMGIRNERDAQVVRNSIALECSKLALNAFILYRGGDLEKDKNVNSERLTNKSLSYGTSLFAGAIYDGNATVFNYTIQENRETFAIIIPFSEYLNSGYYVPDEGALSQLCATGEYWHGRSLLPELEDKTSISGFTGRRGKLGIPQYLKSNFTKEALSQKLNYYHSKAILLTPTKKL